MVMSTSTEEEKVLLQWMGREGHHSAVGDKEPLETLTQFSCLKSHFAKTSVWPYMVFVLHGGSKYLLSA